MAKPEYSLIIRKAVKADAPDILSILKDSFGQYIKLSGIPLGIEDMLDDVGAIERDIDEIDVFIAVLDGVPVGTVRVSVGNASGKCGSTASNAVPDGKGAPLITCAYAAVESQSPAAGAAATARLTKLGVASGYNNIGIGKSLMNLVDKVIIERGVGTLELYTAAKNAKIMRFYYGRGFYVDSTTKDRGYVRALMKKDYL